MNEDREHESEAFAPRRGRVNLQRHSIVSHEDEVYRISEILDFKMVVATELKTGRSRSLRIDELEPIETDISDFEDDLDDIVDDDWRIAQKRFAILKPLLGKEVLGKEEVREVAKLASVNPTTIYRWIKKYNATQSVTSLIPHKRGWRQGNKRISVETEKVIQEVLENFYLTKQRPTQKQTIIEIRRICSQRGVQPPSHMTIRSRIADLPEKKRLRDRGYKEKAKNLFRPVPGKFPNADYPLAVVQIDHTPADIILVDDVHRLPIGRPWITLAIDVHTRMVTGVYISFDAPSLTSVAMCIANSILPKEDFLLQHGVDADWPVWGIPHTIHVDNGADFRSNSLPQSCLAHGINLEFRPVKQPHFGGHVERMLGTLSKEIHQLPGTTFSSVPERDGYDSEKNAVFTKSEFETYILKLITKVYHLKKHSSIDTTPLHKWEVGIFGNGYVDGIGPPPRPADEDTIRLDFLPAFKRTVQNTGVTIDGLVYYSEALRPWINRSDPNTNEKRKFVFRRDPRELSNIWFFDPELKYYFKIPFADQSLPSMSIWEYRKAKEKLKAEGNSVVNEQQLLQTITELREQAVASAAKSKKARRAAQKRKDHVSSQAKTFQEPTTNTTPRKPISKLKSGDIDAFKGFA